MAGHAFSSQLVSNSLVENRASLALVRHGEAVYERLTPLDFENV